MTQPTAPAPIFIRVAWDDPRAVELRSRMDAELVLRYPALASPDANAEAHAALTMNPADVIATVLVLGPDETPVAHGALRMLAGEWEVKRVVVSDDQRGRGIGRALMGELERIGREGHAPRLILHTGDNQPEAVALYLQLGWTAIPVYPPYLGTIPGSLCFEKVLG